MRRANKNFSSYVMSLVSLGFWLWLFLAAAQTAQASVLSDLAASMGPGTWAQLNTNNILPALSNTGGASGMTFGYTDQGIWDPISRQFFFVGGDHNVKARFVTYSESNNTWQTLPTASWFGGGPGIAMHGYHHSAINTSGRFLYHRPFGSAVVQKYNLSTQTWDGLPDVSGVINYISCCVAVTYFPERNSLVYASIDSGTNGAVAEYSEQTGQWQRIQGNLPMGGYHNFAEYNPVHKVVLFGGGNNPGSRKIYKLDASGQITALRDAPIDLGIQQTIVTVDPVSGKYLIFGNSNNFYAYDISTDTWQLQSGSLPIFTAPIYSPAVHGIVATPISNYGVNMFVKCHISTCSVYLYKHASGSGTPPPTAPTVSIFANPSSVVSGSASTLTWNSTNATSCTASNGWSGTKAVSGSQSTGNLTINTTFTLTCIGAGGSTSQSATVTVGPSTPPPSSGKPTLLVNFGKSITLNTFGLSGWSTAIKDIYTDYRDIGPGGTTIVVGDNHTYNYQGVTGAGKTFVSGEKIRVTWYNNSATSVSFTPNISFTDPDRIDSGASGAWYPMTSVAVPSFGSATSEYTFASATAGSYSLVNVNVNHTSTQVIVADKIELLPIGSSPSPSFDFSISNGGTQTVTQGQSVSNNISAALVSGTAQALNFSTSGLPSGAVATFSLTSCTPTCSSSVEITTSNSTPAGSYSITVTASGGESTKNTSFTLTVTTTSSTPPPPSGLTFAQKCAQTGVINCWAFDSSSELRYTWPTGTACDTAMSGKTRYTLSLDRHDLGNTVATVQNGQCVFPTIDTTFIRSGTGSIKFTIPSNSGADSGGYFSEVFKRLPAGGFAYIAPGSSFGNVLYFQFYQRFDSNFLNTDYLCQNGGCGGWKQIIWYGNPPNGSRLEFNRSDS